MPKVANSSAIQNKFFETANIFVDRNEPRGNFWEIYNNYRSEHSSNPLFVQVLAYYGIGGVGKTKLLHKIASELDEEHPNSARHIYFDFNDSQNPIEVLSSIKNILIKKYKFEFPLFELGLYALAQKNGQDMKAPEAKSFFNKSPSLGILLDVAGILPVADLCAKLIKAVDSSVSLISNMIRNHKTSVQAINTLDPQDLQNYLPHLFAKDLNDNVEKNKEPLVIFLDTYEQLVNEVKDGNTIHFADEWLKGDRGLVLNCHNVLWVIAGRERLKWIDLDSDWDGTLLQYSLGQFSESDSIDYLQKAGVEDSTLCKQISKLTSGVPIHLSLCVDVYNRIRESNGVPSINDFGDSFENLIPLFLKRLENESERLLVYLLSYIQTWDDALVKYVADRTLRGDWESSYRRLKVLSFITDTHDGKYNMHQTVSTSIRRSPGVEYQAIRKQIEKKSIEYAISRLEELSAFDSEYSYWLLWLTKFIVSNSSTEESVENQFAEFVYPYWNKLLDYGFFDLALNILDILQYNNLRQGNSWYLANILSLRALALNKKNDEVEAKRIGHDATEMYRQSAKVKSTEYGYRILDDLCDCVCYGGMEEFYLRDFLLDLSYELFGLEDDRTIGNCKGASILSSCISGIQIYRNIPQYEMDRVSQKASQIKREIAEHKKIKILSRLQKKKENGFVDVEAITLIYDMSINYTELDNSKEALKWMKKCISLSEQYLGKEQFVDDYNAFSEVNSVYEILVRCEPSNYARYQNFLINQTNRLIEKKSSEDLITYLDKCHKAFSKSFLYNYSSEKKDEYKLHQKIIDKTLCCYTDIYGINGRETIDYAGNLLKEAVDYQEKKKDWVSSETFCKCMDIWLPYLKLKLSLASKKNKGIDVFKLKLEVEICSLIWSKATFEFGENESQFDEKKLYEKLGDEGITWNETLLKHWLEYYGDNVQNASVLRRLISLHKGKGNLQKAQEYKSMLEESILSFYTKQWEMKKEILGEEDSDTIRCLEQLASQYLLLNRYEEAVEHMNKVIKLSRHLESCEDESFIRHYFGLGRIIRQCSREFIDRTLLRYMVLEEYVPDWDMLNDIVKSYNECQHHSSIPHMDEAMRFMSNYNDIINEINEKSQQGDVDIEEYAEKLKKLLESGNRIMDIIFFRFMNAPLCWILGKLCLLYNFLDHDDESIDCAKKFVELQKKTDYRNSSVEYFVYCALLEECKKEENFKEMLVYGIRLLDVLQNSDELLLSDPFFQLVKIVVGNSLTDSFLQIAQHEKALVSANMVIKMIQEDKNVDPEQKAEAERLLKLAQENIGS